MSIKVNTIIGAEPKTPKNQTFVDIRFDLTEDSQPSNDALYSKSTQTDLQSSIDEGAVMNSIRNIFNTTPGEKILNPEFGVNLTQWLFEPANEQNAREIGEAIQAGINRFEPRVLLTHVTVIADKNKDQYVIQLAIQIPSLNITRTYDAALQQWGFEFLTENE